jgi:hypothetical protein
LISSGTWSVEPDLLDNVQRLAEVVLGLAGKADDDVRRQREIRNRGPHLAGESDEALA